ncbi:PREDICTED: probable pectinesterase/pectinesterase inhibitor 58 [Ipomoea nil]|uniref:probable pectinesterase/pectinesterase inhibitor 58 n=1 Tax=Ipomoea nil TaxID=35883 RepID=UPI00090094B2|nr:PREDICTED: probable pectinesterase/pectinesterase inhibitor 58 [Ipomoea nil]
MSNNVIVMVVCSVLLLAMVVALTVGFGRYDYKERKEVNSSEKAIKSICQPTTYQETCIESLESSPASNTTNPKELIQASLEITIHRLRDAIKKSRHLKEFVKDPRSKGAMDDCQLLAKRAVKDLVRTFEQFSEFDLSDLDNWLADLKTWLSGSLTYQETCLDGFEGTPGDHQGKMKQLLNTSMQLTSNALAMVTEISSVLSNLGVEGVSSSGKRRLMGHRGDDMTTGTTTTPDWVDPGRHRLLTAKRAEIKPDLVVAKDGSGKYMSINEALEDIPRNKNKTFVLYIKEGVYEEKVVFFRNMTHLMIMGDGPTKTKITGSKNYIDGVSTFHTATVAALGDFFMARDIGFENSAGPEKHQAVALRVGADKSIFYNCQMDGYQDTLYTHTYRQFYRNCIISGTIDFIFGNGAVVLQTCTFVVRKPMENQQCIVTAQGRIDPRQPTGLVLQNCSFVADPEYYPVRSKLKSYLGRPWKEYSRTIIMESFIDDLIQKEGWLLWNGDFALDTLFYTEYNNRGSSSSKEERVKWKGVKELPLNRIERFTAARFIQGDVWIKSTRLPYNPGFIFPPPKHNPAVKYSPVMPDEIKDMGAKEKAAYDPPKATPPPPSQFSVSSIFGVSGGSPPTQEPANSSNQTSPPTSTPVHPSPESTSGSSSAPVQAPASSLGSVQAPHQFSTTGPISVTPISAPTLAFAPASSPTTSPQSSISPVSTPAEDTASTSSPSSPGPVQASPQSSTAPVQASASTPSPVQAPAPASAPVSNSASTSVPNPARLGLVPNSSPAPVPTPASTPAPAPAGPSTPPSSTLISAPTPAPTQASTSASSPAPLAPTQVLVAAPPGNLATQVPAAAPPGNSATQVPAAAPPGNSATQVPVAATPGKSATQVPAAAPPGNSATQVPVAATPGKSATQVPAAAPPGNSATQVPSTAPPGNSATQVPAAATPRNSVTQVPAAAPLGNSATQVPAAATPGNSATKVPTAAPPGNSATQVPAAVTSGNSATQVPAATPPGNSTTEVLAAAPLGNSATQVPAAASPRNSATEVPVAAPSGNLDTQVKVAASSKNLITTPLTQTKAGLGPSPEAGNQ